MFIKILVNFSEIAKFWKFRCPWTHHLADQTRATPLPRPQRQFCDKGFCTDKFISHKRGQPFWHRPHRPHRHHHREVLARDSWGPSTPATTTTTTVAVHSSSVHHGSVGKSELWPQHFDDNNRIRIPKIKRCPPLRIELTGITLRLSVNSGFNRNRISPVWDHSDLRITKAASTQSSSTILRHRSDQGSADPSQCQHHLAERHRWCVGDHVSLLSTGAANQRTAPTAPGAAGKEPTWPTQKTTIGSCSSEPASLAKRPSCDSFCTTSSPPPTRRQWTTCTEGSSKFRVDLSASTFKTCRGRTSTSSQPWGQSRWPRRTLSSSSSRWTLPNHGTRLRDWETWSTKPKIRRFQLL